MIYIYIYRTPSLATPHAETAQRGVRNLKVYGHVNTFPDSPDRFTDIPAYPTLYSHNPIHFLLSALFFISHNASCQYYLSLNALRALLNKIFHSFIPFLHMASFFVYININRPTNYCPAVSSRL